MEAQPLNNAQQKLIHFLHDKCYNDLLQYATRKTGDAVLAYDLTQTAFTTAIMRIEEVETHEAPEKWMFKTLAYIVKRELTLAYHSEVEWNEDIPILAEEHSRLEYILPKGLSESEKQILIMKYEKQYDHAMIAETLGLTPTAARKRLSRALEHCRKEWEKAKSLSQKGSLNGYTR